MFSQTLEGDGISSHIFYALAKEDKDLCSAKVKIPPTVLFEQGFAKVMFSNERSGKEHFEIRKKSGRDLPLETVYLIMTRVRKSAEPVAVFIELCLTQGFHNVRFLDANALECFLYQEAEKPRGILQRFVKPKGEKNNVIQVVWTPLLTLADSRRSRYTLLNKHIPLWERCAIFETSLSNTTEVTVSKGLLNSVKLLSEAVVKHCLLVEHVQIARMVYYCKLDHNNDVQFLFTSSIRIADNTGMGFNCLGLTPQIRAKDLMAKQNQHQNDLCEITRRLELLKPEVNTSSNLKHSTKTNRRSDSQQRTIGKETSNTNSDVIRSASRAQECVHQSHVFRPSTLQSESALHPHTRKEKNEKNCNLSVFNCREEGEVPASVKIGFLEKNMANCSSYRVESLDAVASPEGSSSLKIIPCTRRYSYQLH